MTTRKIAAALALGCASATIAARAEEPAWPLRIATPGGEVILASTREKAAYEQYHYSAVRRVDDTLYISGVIVGRKPGEGSDVPAFKLQVRRSLERLQSLLASAGATFADVTMINSFHVWKGPDFTGTRDQQFEAFSAVLNEFVHAPYPAWTAVGTTGLLADTGIVEVQLIAHVPKH